MGLPRRESDPRTTAEALFGAELRAKRVAANLSLRELAPLVLVSHDLIALIEKGRRRPQPDLVNRLDEALGAGGELRTLAAPFRENSRAQPFAFSLAPDTAESSLRDVIVDVRAVDHTMAANRLDDVVAHTNAAEAVVAKVSGDRQNSLLRTIAEAHQLAGWMRFDRGNLAMAERSFTGARLAAERAGALDLVAYVGGPSAGFMSTWSGDPSLGAERAYGSLAWARRSGNRRLTAFVATIAARAHARMGEADLCTQMLMEAESQLAHHKPNDPDPSWLEVFDAAALAGHRGSCLLDLGQPNQAVAALQEQDSTTPTLYVRNRIIWQLEQADAQLRLAEDEAAAAIVEQALDSARADSITPRVVRMFRSIDLKLRISADPLVSTTRDRLRTFIEACA